MKDINKNKIAGLVALCCMIVIIYILSGLIYGNLNELNNPLLDSVFIFSDNIIISIVLILICAVITKRAADIFAETKETIEHDEFGQNTKRARSKLSREEKNILDIQSMANLERIISKTSIQKITKKGSKEPMKDLNNLIGIEPVKIKVKEMVARMQFNKGKTMDDTSKHMVFLGAPGTGKAQPLYSKVLTPAGFKLMGEIKKGDTVISGTGKESTVVEVYPQGEKDVYEVILNDGSKCRCSNEHLFKVYDNKESTYKVITIDDIKNNFEPERWMIDYVTPIRYKKRKFIIHPFLMGTLLGGFTIDEGIMINVSDVHAEMIKKVLPNNYSISKTENNEYKIKYLGHQKDVLYTYLKSKWLLRCPDNKKHIPEEYLLGSVDQRLMFLQGFSETGGLYQNNDIIECMTSSAELCNDIKEIIHSMGGFAFSEEKKEVIRSKNSLTIKNKRFIITVKLPENISKKLKFDIPALNERRIITSITPVAKEVCQCIYIDDESHTYITDGHIITHNTTVARIITGFLYKNGYIKENKIIEVDGNFLKSGTPGDTSTKTKFIIRQAYNGVLFIDEAYALTGSGDNCGREAVATLLKEMEDNRDKFILILAGYTNEMKDMLNTNPGFKSRIRDYLLFPDYTNDELCSIFNFMANGKNFVVSAEAMDNFRIRIERERSLNSYGNARTVRNVLDEAMDKHSYNYMKKKISEDDKYRLVAKDVNKEPDPVNLMIN